MAPGGRVKKPARSGDLDLGAGVPLGKAFGGGRVVMVWKIDSVPAAVSRR